MTNGKLVDTNFIVALNNGEATAQQLAAQYVMYVPSIVIGELYFGAYKSTRVASNIANIDQWAKSDTILNCDVETAKIYGQIKNQLKIKGKPIPENDIWIAAIAVQYNLMLVTRDQQFKHVDQLQLEGW